MAAGDSPRIKRDCVCKRAKHVHGTRTAYVIDKCRCRPCTDASATENRLRNRAKLYGRYDSGRVDAAPVREHLTALMGYGIGLKRIAVLAGVSNATLGKILYGDRTRSMPPRERTERHVAEGVLAVKPQLANLGQTVNVDGAGTRRRLQALVAIGWSQSRLAVRLGMSAGNFGRTFRSERVQAETARQVQALYEDLWNQPQTGHDQRSRISVSRARNQAAAHGWLPPLAWDDDIIDDPATEPSVFVETPLIREDRVAEIEFLIVTGCGRDEVVRRSGFQSLKSLEKFCHRQGRGDVVARVKSIGERAAA